MKTPEQRLGVRKTTRGEVVADFERSTIWSVYRSQLAALSLAVATALLSSAAPASQGGARPNILLITVDTLRADRVGAYGYKTAHTPAMDKLAAEGVRFADATAHAVLTLPAHAAILTGRNPGAFGLRLNGMGAVPGEAHTLAELLKGVGYRTGAVVASAVLDNAFGLDQGFDDYDDRIGSQTGGTVAIADLHRSADQVTAAATHWVAAQKGPWFLWVHYYDPHLPYSAPPKYAALTPGRPYDAEVAFADAEIGELLASVDRARTAIVLTADHGEALGDHGEPDHGFFLYDSTLHIPLIVTAPGLTPRVVNEQVRHIDLAPTVAEIAGAPLPPVQGDVGESLVPLLNGGSRKEIPVSIAESWYPRLHFGWSELRSARVGEWKYIAAPRPELYDLRVDRAEARNVASDRATVAGRLASDLSKVTERFGQSATVQAEQPDPAAVERLQALGYLGAFSPTASGNAAADPKDHITEYREYRSRFNRALDLLGRGRFAEAALALQQLVKLNVRAFEAHLYLGNAYAGQGNVQAALGEYDAASLLNPTLATPHIEAAKVLSNNNDHAAAIVRCRKGLDRSPRSDYAHYTLGVIYRRADRWGEAADAFTRATELNPVNVRARSALASAAQRIRRLDIATAQLEKMIELGYQVAAAQFNLGIIAAGQGNRAEAERRYRLALQADAGFKPARDALAKLK
jgi:arylsulfatase A-like enzyme/Tfp pilus assembly protein PilF